MQLYVALNSDDLGDLSAIESCASDVSRWLVENVLLVIHTITDAVIVGTSQRLMSRKLTCSSPTASNCSERRSTHPCHSTSTTSISLARVSTTSVHCVIYDRLNNDSSAAVNKSVIVGTSSAQYQYRLLRLKNASSRARSLAEQRPDHAGAQ